MKRISGLVVIVSILVTFLAVNSFADDVALKLTAKHGKVFFKSPSSSGWAELVVGQMVHSKDIIRTDITDTVSKEQEALMVDANGKTCPLGGYATLELPDKSSVSIKPGSEISVDELVLSNASRKLKLNMTKGELRMIIAKVSTPSDFSVKTPNAIYGATGTIFYVKNSPEGGNVYVGDGSINVISPKDGKTYSVPAGMKMNFGPDGALGGPVPVSGMDVSNWTSCYSPAAEPYTPVGHIHLIPPQPSPERPVSGS